MLFNLQHIEGFGDLMSRMRTVEPEAAIADLQIGKILYMLNIPFRFVTPQQKLGDDYDMEITYPDGVVVCAETKCRIEKTVLGPSTIRNALRKARGQLPPNRPGIIFVKCPQQWFEDGKRETTQRQLLADVSKFFGRANESPRNQRIVSVKFYAEVLTYSDGVVENTIERIETSHHRNKFYPNRDWDFPLYQSPPGEFFEMPLEWVRLINFPSELRHHAEDK